MKIVKKKNKPKIVFFTAVKNRCMLNGRVFVMHRFNYVNKPILNTAFFKTIKIDNFHMNKYFCSYV